MSRIIGDLQNPDGREIIITTDRILDVEKDTMLDEVIQNLQDSIGQGGASGGRIIIDNRNMEINTIADIVQLLNDYPEGSYTFAETIHMDDGENVVLLVKDFTFRDPWTKDIEGEDWEHYNGRLILENAIASATTYSHKVVTLHFANRQSRPFRPPNPTNAFIPLDWVGMNNRILRGNDVIPVNRGGTGAITAAQARANLGAGTSDLTLGTTATTAAAGNHTHPIADTTGTLPVNRGGTNRTSQAAGNINYATSATAMGAIAPPTANVPQALVHDATTVAGLPVWRSLTGLDSLQVDLGMFRPGPAGADLNTLDSTGNWVFSTANGSAALNVPNVWNSPIGSFILQVISAGPGTDMCVQILRRRNATNGTYVRSKTGVLSWTPWARQSAHMTPSWSSRIAIEGNAIAVGAAVSAASVPNGSIAIGVSAQALASASVAFGLHVSALSHGVNAITVGGRNAGFNAGIFGKNRTGNDTSRQSFVGPNDPNLSGPVLGTANAILIGGAGITPQVNAAVQVLSDERDKIDIKPTQETAYDFIKTIEPISYQYDYRDHYSYFQEITEDEYNKLHKQQQVETVKMDKYGLFDHYTKQFIEGIHWVEKQELITKWYKRNDPFGLEYQLSNGYTDEKLCDTGHPAFAEIYDSDKPLAEYPDPLPLGKGWVDGDNYWYGPPEHGVLEMYREDTAPRFLSPLYRDYYEALLVHKKRQRNASNESLRYDFDSYKHAWYAENCDDLEREPTDEDYYPLWDESLKEGNRRYDPERKVFGTAYFIRAFNEPKNNVPEPPTKSFGFSAQNLLESAEKVGFEQHGVVVSNAYEDEEGNVAYSSNREQLMYTPDAITAALVKTVQRLQAKIEELEAMVVLNATNT